MVMRILHILVQLWIVQQLVFKYFDIKNIHQISIDVRGYIKGSFEVKTAWDGKVLAQIPVEYTNVWKHYSTPVDMPDGEQALLFYI